MNTKAVLVAFNGEPMCFVHVLLNALEMKKRGFEVKVVIEGTATKLVNVLNDPDNPFHNKYTEVRDAGLIDAVCRACAVKMEALGGAEEQGLPIRGDMNGHPALGAYIEDGYQVITF